LTVSLALMMEQASRRPGVDEVHLPIAAYDLFSLPGCRRRYNVVTAVRDFIDAGGLMSYGRPVAGVFVGA
jgi:hypothetical protein